MSAVASRLPRSDRDERRETILQIAHAAFLEDGYAATSMSSIAARFHIRVIITPRSLAAHGKPCASRKP